MRTWRPHRLLRWFHTALAVCGLVAGAALLALAATADEGVGQLYGMAGVLIVFSGYLLLLAFNRRVSLTDDEVVVRNLVADRHISLTEVASAAPGHGAVDIRLTDGSRARVMAVGTYHWLAPGLSRADEVSRAVKTAAGQVRAGGAPAR
ncbi:hypothetical protein FBY35_1145 [Streptomyces sp. SLBN-118]|uniref:hypothetical protein n=1 Tax=Streptomyces sp. SLBN-118 TaxID=2768454 RepID=UPI0011513A6F|nr:hypothetical protein [Streptomyces sp. SLBN-118]TQK50792.1 hypothetical protein FBY35_1145 [Streptomyces sp. SLBN-118]